MAGAGGRLLGLLLFSFEFSWTSKVLLVKVAL